MVKFLAGVAALVLFAASAGTVLADASGKALGVDPAAEARLNDDVRTLVVGSDIFLGDRVVTGDAGLVQIMFSDQTRLVVGPRSEMLIEDYLLRGDGSAGKFAVNALSGTFRFITGGAPKDRYVIETPTGTIGVRGTALDFYVTALATYVLQLHGSSFECPDSSPGNCAVLDAICQMGILDPDEMQIIGHTDDLDGDDRAEAKQMFRYAFSQHDLLHQFKVAGAEQCLRRSTVFTPESALSTPLSSDGLPGGEVYVPPTTPNGGSGGTKDD